MVLSNAERQARYRERLRARASLDNLGAQAQKAVDRALETAWAFFQRPSPDGGQWADTDGLNSIEEFRALLSGGPQSLVETCRGLLLEPTGLSDEERKALRVVVEVYEAVTLTDGN